MYTDNSGQTDPPLAFHIMKFAFQLFKKPATKLSPKEYCTVKQHAEQEVFLHDMILSSEYASGVVIPSSVIDYTLESLKNEYSKEEDFFEYLSENSLRLSNYLDLLTSDLKVEAILARVAARDSSVSNREVKEYYHIHQDSFFIPEQRDVRHILICTENQYSHLPKDSALNRMLTIYSRLLDAPYRFDEQARRYSECVSAPDGGNLGKVKPGELCEELDSHLFMLEEGEISEIIQTPFGFHLLYCEKVYPAQPMVFSEAYLKIHQILGRKKKLQSCREWLESLFSLH